ncbi:MAG: DUF6088 family protein [Tannerella sp.]|jgi:hypothetical protein|nr:DUF6088 family protein [Tannerella sp.]
MINGIDYKIFEKIKKTKRGALFFANNFVAVGNIDTVYRTLNRLVEKGELDKVTNGIY